MPRQGCIPYIQLAILILLEKQGPLCGYGLYKRLRAAGLDVSEAVVYTALSRMSQRGLVRAVRGEKDGRQVVLYEITEKGVFKLRKLYSVFWELSRAIEALAEGPETGAGK
ncbi:hypothetical protein CF15_07685 [Pyrodictium occultum]|uniref:Transcription regulator PadR N-terminal domain-containing protein n=1 Tax=Pyrodictium occultum TaxID=2309 RepID=A0A0V8RX08_PYROC|nr:PadR family transcriptional regulator [Pyrodictium occultum]KSW12587.1 hypothetical protein CF15_07685 [Pyrodictium occultum]